MPLQPRRKCRRIPRLHKHRPRPRELADQPLAARKTANDTARGRTLEDVLAVPGDEVSVVDDVFLVGLELGYVLAPGAI